MNGLNSYTWILLFCLFGQVSHAQEFRLQLAAFVQKVPFTHFAFSGINDVYRHVDQNSIHRYYLRDCYYSIEQAEKAQKELIRRGFLNAQIIDIQQELSLCGKTSPFSSMGRIYSNISTESLYFRNLFFGFNKSSLSLSTMRELDSLYEILHHNPNLSAFVVGHTDAMGSAAYNIKLSKRRARMVRNYLVAKGIHAKRLKVTVYGESAPLAINRKLDGADSPEGRKYNRRVLVAVMNTKGEVINDLVRTADVPGHLQVNKQILRQQLIHVRAEK
ncbi:MAG: OmpA family protein [Bacteroidota bacterium]